MTPTIIKCGCCREGVSSDKTQWDSDISEHVCPDCAADLANADSAMRHEWEKSGSKGKYPALHHGPYAGNSVG